MRKSRLREEKNGQRMVYTLDSLISLAYHKNQYPTMAVHINGG